MTLRGLIKAGAAVQIARYALRRRRRRMLVERQRSQRLWAGLALVAGGGAAFWYFWQRREATPAWVLKKQRKQARRDAARLERERPAGPPGELHLESDADTSLKVPLGEQLK
jgi:hypothetical protein